MDGAAYAIVAGTVVMCLVMAWYSLKVFPVHYDWLKLSLLFIAGIVLGWFQFLVGPMLPQAGALFSAKTALLALYPDALLAQILAAATYPLDPIPNDKAETLMLTVVEAIVAPGDGDNTDTVGS